MIGPELQRLIQILSNESSARLDQTFRALRAYGLIPTSPRGGAPERMHPTHAAWLLLSLAIDRAPEKAVAAVSAWGEMRPRDDGTAFVTFGAALAGILSDDRGTLLTLEVRICRDWPYATITAGDEGARKTYEFGARSAEEAAVYGTFRPAPIRSEYVISGGALHQTAIDLADQNRGAVIIG